MHVPDRGQAPGPSSHPAGFLAAIGALARHGPPGTLLRFGRSPGDAMLCTAVLHELRRRGARRLWMETDRPELFRHSPDADVVVPYNRRVRRLLRLAGGRAVYPDYAPYDPARDRSRSPRGHIITLMCRHVLSGPVRLRPYLYLSEAERRAAAFADGSLVIQSSALSAAQPMANKDWGAESFQAVVDGLAGGREILQIGAPADPPLRGVRDCRGLPLREAAAILSRADCFIGLVGFLMHLARAVDCRSVIVYGGRESPAQSGYVANENLASDIECAPCWQWNTCDHDRACLRRITPPAVVAAVRRQLQRVGQALPVQTDEA